MILFTFRAPKNDGQPWTLEIDHPSMDSAEVGRMRQNIGMRALGETFIKPGQLTPAKTVVEYHPANAAQLIQSGMHAQAVANCFNGYVEIGSDTD